MKKLFSSPLIQLPCQNFLSRQKFFWPFRIGFFRLSGRQVGRMSPKTPHPVEICCRITLKCPHPVDIPNTTSRPCAKPRLFVHGPLFFLPPVHKFTPFRARHVSGGRGSGGGAPQCPGGAPAKQRGSDLSLRDTSDVPPRFTGAIRRVP